MRPNRKLNIILLLPSYFPDTVGGAEQHTRILAQALNRMGHLATLVAPTQTRAKAGEAFEEGVKVVRIFTKHPPFLGGRKLLSLLQWWREVYRFLKERHSEIDVVAIQHLRLHSVPGIRFATKFQKVVSGKLGRGGEHFDLRLLRGKKFPMGRWLAETIIASDILYIANSKDIEDDLVREGAKLGNIISLPNGVECPEKAAATFSDDFGITNFIFVGRLEQEKGVLNLVEAFGALIPKYPNVRLKIFGAGTLRSSVEEWIERFCLGSSVKLMGIEDNKERIFANGAFFVLPSESEGMSNSLLEAMAHGVVPIVTPVSGVADLIREDISGIIIPSNGIPDIKNGLEVALSLPEERWVGMSEICRGAIGERFGIDQVAAEYVKLYESALDNLKE